MVRHGGNMKYGRYGWSYRFLNWGLGATFLWIGIDIFMHAQTWLGYVPAQLPLGLTREGALQLNGLLDVVIGVALLLQWWPRLAAGLAVLHLLGIVATQGIDAVIIRDVGLLGAALALTTWPHGYKRHRLQKLWRRKRGGIEGE